MPPTRRAFLQLGGAAAGAALSPGLAACGGSGGADDSAAPEGAAPAPGRSEEPPRWSPPGAEDATAFPFGVQSGDATATSVLLSVRSRGLDAVQIVVQEADGTAWAPFDVLDGLVPDDEGVVQVELTGLAADTAYAWAAASADGARWSRAGRVRTALADDGLRQVTFGATSCLGGNDPWPNLSVAATEDLDFFCLLGDTVYADGAQTLEHFRLSWREALQTRGLQDVTASTSIVATWDDHELTNNDGWADLPDETFAAGLQAFRESLPQRLGPGGLGVWRRLTWGRTLDLFVLDCRSERAGGDYVSAEQLAWLQDGLLDSAARFKIVLTSVPITDETAFIGDAGAADRWQGYPAQRGALLDHVTENDIEGVLFVSGDHHFGMVAHVGPRGEPSWDLWEVLVGPSGSFLNAAAALYSGDEQYPLMFAEWNATRFHCDPGTGAVTVTFVGDDGAVLAEQTLSL